MPRPSAAQVWQFMNRPLWSRRVSRILHVVAFILQISMASFFVYGVLFWWPRRVSLTDFLVPALIFGSALHGVHAHLAARREEKRRRSGQCLKCGYDLRASPTPCPECGTPATPLWLR